MNYIPLDANQATIKYWNGISHTQLRNKVLKSSWLLFLSFWIFLNFFLAQMTQTYLRNSNLAWTQAVHE